ncbi:hypothetical protein [Roseovarius sp. ZX-A-9]|uniref:hypothetical protein n=1 Tax=Roseovarius sp. ZX-A-9 TaxID=3014783 RepID=UPI00232AA511|nr:hypothetical protein [Roseovarius sp. ZX-A-9]
MLLSEITIISAVALASAAMAEPLAGMEGTWRGSGWAKETQQSPQETVRCQIKNSYDSAGLTLTLSGQCVVPGRRLTISGTLTGFDGMERITGRWSNPDGIGSTRVVGVQLDDIVAFKFNMTDPTTGRNLGQNVEWRVSEEALRLRSTDRSDPTIMMSDISFTR